MIDQRDSGNAAVTCSGARNRRPRQAPRAAQTPLRPRRRRPSISRHAGVSISSRLIFQASAFPKAVGHPAVPLAGRKGGHPAGGIAGIAASPQDKGALAVMPDPGGQAMLIESRTASRPEADMSFEAS
jgi:hypothetical protein